MNKDLFIIKNLINDKIIYYENKLHLNNDIDFQIETLNIVNFLYGLLDRVECLYLYGEVYED